MWSGRRVAQAAGIVALIALIAVMVMVRRDPPLAESTEAEETKRDGASSAGHRADALARAQVWRRPAVPVARASLKPRAAPRIECKFTVTDLSGTTPKFHCLLASGKEVRAKYGFAAEIPAEAAATRLLAALGFGADSVTLVERIRCFGCPKEPFVTLKVVETTRTGSLYEKMVDHSRYEEFDWVAVEDRFEAPAIETSESKGWAFYELDLVDESKGGAPRAHVDALRLLAVFLAHWDNKSENQRLVCLSSGWVEGTRCPDPFLMLQDVGATFGPRKVDLASWESAIIWEDRGTCAISMRDMPYRGGTFAPARVSEGGRQFLGRLLGELTDAQLVDMFDGARFDEPRNPLTQRTPVSEWVRVFKKRVAAIQDGPPCPEVS